MEIRFNIDEDYIRQLKAELGETKNTAIISEALALYKWAADQKKKGKDILSANDVGEDVEKIILPGLDKLSFR